MLPRQCGHRKQGGAVTAGKSRPCVDVNGENPLRQPFGENVSQETACMRREAHTQGCLVLYGAKPVR